jgi:hypothetical protein
VAVEKPFSEERLAVGSRGRMGAESCMHNEPSVVITAPIHGVELN